MSTHDTVIREVLDMWADGLESTLNSWRKHCAPDLLWWNSARGGVKGLEACLAGIETMFSTLDIAYVKVPVRNLDVLQGRVVVERSDDSYRADGSIIARVPVTGIVEFTDGRISTWRDYCDDWMGKLETGSPLGPQFAP